MGMNILIFFFASNIRIQFPNSNILNFFKNQKHIFASKFFLYKKVKGKLFHNIGTIYNASVYTCVKKVLKNQLWKFANLFLIDNWCRVVSHSNIDQF